MFLFFYAFFTYSYYIYFVIIYKREKMYLELAKKLLSEEYENKYQLANAHGKRLMDEKIRHSYQVLGMGNYLLKNEDVFKNGTSDEIDFLKAIVLLHDIGRFQEGVTSGIDHGVFGADLLKDKTIFNMITAYLPIKHHGHLIEELYDDVDYKALGKEEKNIIDRYIYLIRDADKLANSYLLFREFAEFETLFFSPMPIDTKYPSEKVLSDFMACKSVNKKDIKSHADHALMIIACVYDLKYKSSFVFLKKMKIIEGLFDLFSKFWIDENIGSYKKQMFDFMEQKLK